MINREIIKTEKNMITVNSLDNSWGVENYQNRR